MASSFIIESECLPLNRSAGFSQKVIDGVRDLMLVLAADGRVLHASHMCFPLTTIPPEVLVGNYITSFMHYDDLPVFLAEFTESMVTGNTWRHHHRLRRQDDSFAPFESTFRPYMDNTIAKAAGLPGMPMCLMTTRPYPVASSALMDSFLEHCTAQIQLHDQLEQLRSEAQDDYQPMITATACVQDGNTIECASITVKPTMYPMSVSSPVAEIVSVDRIPMGPQSSHQRTFSGSSSTKQLADSLIGDIGIEITTSRLQVVQDTGLWAAKPRSKKKREETPKEYLCRECGTTNSPEWRRGPLGPKTLCNACGLRWSKITRKLTSSE